MTHTGNVVTHIPALLQHHDALHLVSLLNASGFETRFIGGCVRDALLARHSGDIDLATTATPQQIIEHLSAHQIQTVPVGIEHGTVMAVINGRGYEMTTLRHDVVTDGRHAVVAFTDNWAEDARRRDFTVNALSVDASGKLYDYCGGLHDLQNRTLRFIDDAASRIKEDYLRMLRLFRFASVLHWDITDTALLSLCRNLAPQMKQLSRERVQAELYKLLNGSGCLSVIRLMIEYGIFSPWTDHLDPDALHHTSQYETAHDIPFDAFRRFIALIGYNQTDIIHDMVVLSKQQKKRLQDITYFAEQNVQTWKQAHFCYAMGLQATEDCLVLFTPEHWSYAFLQQWEKPLFPLKAEHLIADTGGGNALLGQVLKQVEQDWVAQDFTPDLQTLLNHARTLIAAQKTP